MIDPELTLQDFLAFARSIPVAVEYQIAKPCGCAMHQYFAARRPGKVKRARHAFCGYIACNGDIVNASFTSLTMEKLLGYKLPGTIQTWGALADRVEAHLREDYAD